MAETAATRTNELKIRSLKDRLQLLNRKLQDWREEQPTLLNRPRGESLQQSDLMSPLVKDYINITNNIANEIQQIKAQLKDLGWQAGVKKAVNK
jgi:capsid portal protein